MTPAEAALIIDRFNRHWKPLAAPGDDCLFVARLRLGGLPDEHIAHVINTLNETCPECFDAPRGCQCWNNE